MAAVTRMLTAALFFSTVALAMGRADRLTLRAEHESDGFRAQQAVVFEQGRVLVSRNSNFFCEAESSVELGVFETPYNAALRSERGQLDQVRARLPRAAGADSSASPHELKLYLNKTDVTEVTPARLTVSRILTAACSLKGLKPQRAVRVTLEEGAGPARVRVRELGAAGPKDAGKVLAASEVCRSRGAQTTAETSAMWDCAIKGYGRVFLRRARPGR